MRIFLIAIALASAVFVIQCAIASRRKRGAAAILEGIFSEIRLRIESGISTATIEGFLQKRVTKHSVVPYFKGYRAYPSIVSTPVNHEIVHTPPTARLLVNGDILTIEFGLRSGHDHAFLAWTFPVGEVSQDRARLLTGARQALDEAIGVVRNNAHTGEISAAIEDELSKHSLIPSRAFQGYRIGKNPVMRPAIPCYKPKAVGETPKVETGMRLAIIVIAHSSEPKLMVNRDKWTVHDAHRGDSAYFSALVEVTEDGCRKLIGTPPWSEPRVGAEPEC